MTNPTVRMARHSARHPWRALIGWLLFVALCLGAGIALGARPATTEDYRIGEAGRAEALAAEGGLQQKPLERVLIQAASGTGPLDRTEAEAAAREIGARMRQLPEVLSVADPVADARRTALRVDVTMKGAEFDGKQHVDALLAQTAEVQAAHPRLLVEEVGSPSIGKGVDELRGDDLSRTEVIALPVTLITLLIVFGSVVMAVVPLLLALTAIVAAVGLSMIASHVFPDAGVGTNVILLIGLAVGVDYTLFHLKREREERARAAGGRLTTQAVVELAAATSGRAVVVSGLAVAVSSATLYLADDVIFSSIATGAVVVTLVAVLSSLTVLPALLALLGERAERRRARGKRVRDRAARAGRPGGRLTAAVLRPVARHPAVTLAVSTLALLALALPVLDINITEMSRETHSRAIPAMRTYDRLMAAYPELKAMHQVVVRADAERAEEVAGSLRALADRASAEDPAIGGAPVLRTSADRRTTMLELAVPRSVNSPEARASLDRLRTDLVPGTVGALTGTEVAVTGEVARYADYPDHQKRKLPLIVGALLLVTFVMTVWAFRSVVLGLVGILLNLLSAFASLGVLVLVFQHRWAEGILDFTSTGSIGSRVPLFLFVILFGLSMDYQVFVISRIREARLSGVPTRQAVLQGLSSSAGVVTSAAVVMVTVFASFAALHLIEMKQIGFSLAVAVLLDAFVIRVLVLPSLMLLLGEANWWPAHGMRRSGKSERAGTPPVSVG
ncbi:MMPL family transporter [Streptomyces vietnamensis]|uniref:Membrane protein n=1 Tax=Streptomyces vietnamensis TaxID=362257 RepID=A0A0B5HYS5_9ACTN|nr:MMPL family transporter [Streptomyces vietnamensis]AJF63462.1 membrane protein [Streptomyces vietnamensis]